MSDATRAFFLDADHGRAGQRFCMLHTAQAPQPLGTVLFVHAFAEEMNKSRRMAQLQSRALAASGMEVLQIDLHGCGDSSGDFGDATWQGWIDDVVHAAQWLQARQAGAPLWLWGHRAGCLLACEAAAKAGFDCHFLFWAPPPSGKALLQQFLRLKTAGAMLTGAASGGGDSLRQELARGASVEIAGYTLGSGLAQGLEQSTLTPPRGRAARLEWIDVSARESATLSPIAAKTVAAWTDAGHRVRTHAVQGPSFWQTTEIEDVPQLVTATVAAVAGATEVTA